MKRFFNQLWSRRVSAVEAADLNVRIRAEGSRLRVDAGSKTEWFVGSDPVRLLRELRSSVATVQFRGLSDASGNGTLCFSTVEQTALRVTIALHWIRYYRSTGQPVRITAADLSHPQTWDIVLRQAEAKYGARSDSARSLAASVLGITTEQLELWRRVEDDRISIM